MTPVVVSQRSIFSKNHDYNSYIYIKSFPCRGEHVRTYISGSRCMHRYKTVLQGIVSMMHAMAENYEQTHTYTHVGQPQ